MLKFPWLDYYFIIAETKDSQGTLLSVTAYCKVWKWCVPDFEKVLKDNIEYSCNIRSVIKL